LISNNKEKILKYSSIFNIKGERVSGSSKRENKIINDITKPIWIGNANMDHFLAPEKNLSFSLISSKLF
jgi:hypothetical protein